jgi:hypothetical protein
VVELFLRAVWEEYQGTYDRESAEKNFRSYREEFRLYSTFKKMQIVLTFAIQGKIGLIPIRFAAAKWIQAQMIKIFIAMGATMAALGIAEQVARKVAIAVEVVFAAGCGVYCGSVAVAQNIVEVSTYIAEGIDATMDILKSFGTAIGAIFSRPLLVLKARLDPLNWDLSSLPSQTQTDIGLLGLDLWDMIGTETVNTFLTDLSRPLSSFEISPDMIQIIAQEMSESTLPITGLEFVFTPDLILGLTPVEFVELLQDWQFMEFLRDPWQIADEALAAQPE